MTELGLVGGVNKGKEYKLDDVIFKVFTLPTSPHPTLISCYMDTNVNELFLTSVMYKSGTP